MPEDHLPYEEDIVEEARRRSAEWMRQGPRDREAAINRLQGDVERAFDARNPELVDAADLTLWADRRQAQEVVPDLLRRLVLMAPGVSRVTGRAGDGIALPGWDLLAESGSGDPFVPHGTSAWEVGTSRDPRRKAESDLQKRTAEPLGVDPSSTVFIFVTPRRWPGKDAWAAERSAEGTWREVRVYDADDLETWLLQRPSVHYWLSLRLGRRPDAAVPLDSWWQAWSRETAPELSPELILAGRDGDVRELEDWLASESPSLNVQGDSPDEALAFVASSLLAGQEVSGLLALERSVVVRDAAAWDQLSASPVPLLLLPLDMAVSARDALERGHRIIAPVGLSASVRGPALRLSRLRRDEARAALVGLGIPDRQADGLARLARRSLLAFRRQFGVSPTLRKPLWADDFDGPQLAPVTLLGRWSDAAPGDREVLTSLTQRAYEEVERDLFRWAGRDDPPLRRMGSTWLTSSREDLWLLLSQYITQTQVRDILQAVLDALREVDPAFGLKRGQQHMASVLGHKRHWSGDMRQGLADLCAFVASRPADEHAVGPNLTEGVEGVVGSVFEWASGDQSGDRWASLTDVVTLLAEASPDTFLRWIESGTSGPEPVMREIFRDGSDVSDAFGPSSPHTSVLWALEGLCWEPELLSRAAGALASLAAVDPGGRLMNRPAASLWTVFLLYQPHTGASLDQRTQVLDLIFARHPGVGWQLFKDLLPGKHDWWSTTHAPKWRDWRPDEVPRASVDEIVESCHSIVTRMMRAAEDSGDRWSDLIDVIADLPRGSREAVIAGLTRAADVLDVGEQHLVWRSLDKLVEKHRRYPDAKWTLSNSVVQELADLQGMFQAPPGKGNAAELFGFAPSLPGIGRDRTPAYEQALLEARTAVVEHTLRTVGFAGLLEIAEEADAPESLGMTLVEAGGGVPLEDVAPLLERGGNAWRFASGYVAAWSKRNGRSALSEQIQIHAEAWPAAVKAQCLLSGGVDSGGLELLATMPPAVQEEYWNLLPPHWVPASLASEVVPQLLEHGRAWAAIDVLAFAVPSGVEQSSVPVALIVRSLDAALFGQDEPGPSSSSLSYHLGQLLDALDGRDDENLARFEFALLRLLEHQRTPRALLRQLGADPSFFSEVVSYVYKADVEVDHEEETTVPDPGSDADEGGSSHMAELSYTLLQLWDGLPGQLADGSVDAAKLDEWFERSRELLRASGRTQVADYVLGQVLANSPPGDDGAWPAAAVREIIDRTASESLDRGLQIGRVNSRGVTVRNPLDGGAQEREIAIEYKAWASLLSTQWPRTAGVLRDLARSYEQEARWHDDSADRWADPD